jgi:glucose/arabinose dehydrogenase
LRLEPLEDRNLLAPTLLDPALMVQPVVENLNTPINMAFLGDNDFLVLEKNTGKVQHVVDGQVVGTALDLPVNFASERGLLGIALDPEFATNHNVYLRWTETLSGQDSSNLDDVPLLGNRVDRYVWDGSQLTFDRNLIHLRAWQPPDPPYETSNFGNHNGGVMRFGPDGKLYIVMGDNGRRGWMQNITDALGPDGQDDQFGGPAPDDTHLTGVMLRLNTDGSAPTDNPFYGFGASLGGEVGANIQKVFAYGIRNSFGFAFDPYTGSLWLEENGDDSFDKISRVDAGANNGWIQSMGPLERVAEYKGIENTPRFFGLQQLRWPPTLIQDTPEGALNHMFMMPGAHYNPPEMSWRYAVPPAGVGFVTGAGLGGKYLGNLFVGAATANTFGGHLFRFKFNAGRTEFAFDDPRLFDKVADNFDKNAITESESLLIGTDFGVVPDIQTGPDGNLYLASLDQGAVYRISLAPLQAPAGLVDAVLQQLGAGPSSRLASTEIVTAATPSAESASLPGAYLAEVTITPNTTRGDGQVPLTHPAPAAPVGDGLGEFLQSIQWGF